MWKLEKLSVSMTDKVFIITGAAKGMGLAISEHMLKLNARVIMVYLSDVKNAREVKKHLASHQGRFKLVQADITNPKDRGKIIEQAINNFGQIDVLVNNAGIPAKSGFLNETEDEFDKVLDVNLKAPIFLAQSVAKTMIERKIGGSIINISSICGHRAMGGISYDSAKTGIIRATQTMANTLGPHGIRVNSISPGYHKTEMNRAHWTNETDSHKKSINVTALKRAAEAFEIAGTVEYLASDLSSYTTGTDIIVDGGFLSHCPGRD